MSTFAGQGSCRQLPSLAVAEGRGAVRCRCCRKHASSARPRLCGVMPRRFYLPDEAMPTWDVFVRRVGQTNHTSSNAYICVHVGRANSINYKARVPTRIAFCFFKAHMTCAEGERNIRDCIGDSSTCNGSSWTCSNHVSMRTTAVCQRTKRWG